MFLTWSLCVHVSVQCRLEANYAHQQELDMIPLMMQKDYKPQGWRKSESERQALRRFVVSGHVADVEALCARSCSGPDHGHALVVRDVGRGAGRRCGLQCPY